MNYNYSLLKKGQANQFSKQGLTNEGSYGYPSGGQHEARDSHGRRIESPAPDVVEEGVAHHDAGGEASAPQHQDGHQPFYASKRQHWNWKKGSACNLEK